MKTGFIHVCFIIDESGSMAGSESDVCSGFNKVIEEQKALIDGSCAVSLYRFESTVTKDFIGKDVSEIGKMKSVPLSYNLTNILSGVTLNTSTEKTFKELENNDLTYSPGGCTAMNDGIGKAITEIGRWLADMPEEERPEKNLIVIMTDGEENSSREYSIDKVKEMIKHQTEKYNWTFVYMGTDVTDASYANFLGIHSSYTSKDNHMANYAMVNSVTSAYRSCTADYLTKNAMFETTLTENLADITADYINNKGVTITT